MVANLRTVLIIDNDPVILDILRRYLLRSGFHHFMMAEHSASGLDILRRQSAEIALVLIDLTLSTPNGWMLAQIIRLEMGFRHLPLFAMTTRTVHEVEDTVLDAGFDGILTKPFDFAYLQATLEKYLGV
jgi:DNA-binding response OmpR family regulator